MKTITGLAVAGALTLGLATAAQAQVAQIPTPANPFPAYPVASNGTPLPRTSSNLANEPMYSGRSAYVGPGAAPLAPVGDAVGLGVGVAGAAVGTGLGIAGGAVDTGLTAADVAVGGPVR